MNKPVVMLLSSLWGILVFRMALAVHFPVEAIQNRIAYAVEQSSAQKMQLQVEGMDLYSIVGLQMNKATVFKKTPTGESTKFMELENTAVSLSVLDSMFGKLGISGYTDILDGNFEFSMQGDSFSPSKMQTSTNWSKLSLSLLPIQTDSFQANLEGLLQGEIHADFDIANFHKTTNGDFNISVDGLAIRGAKAQGIDIPDLQFSQALLKGSIVDGKVNIGTATFVANGISMDIGGEVVLAKNVERSRIKLDVELTLGSEYTLLSQIIPILKNNKTPDGTYKISVIGTLQNPRVKGSQPDRSALKNNRRLDVVPDDMEDDSDGMDTNTRPPVKTPEERRKERRERIERRKQEQQNKHLSPDDLGKNNLRKAPFEPNIEEEDVPEEVVEPVIEEEQPVEEDNQEPQYDNGDNEDNGNGSDDDNQDE